MMNTKRILDEEKVKDFVGDFNKYFEDLAKRYKRDAKKIKTRRECFWRKYPEIFRDSSENEVEMDIDEGKTRPKKPNLQSVSWILAQFYFNRGLQRLYTGTCIILQKTINGFLCLLIVFLKSKTYQLILKDVIKLNRNLR